MAVAIDKYVCPFCGQKTLFVGVHDDEGNYKGRPGCDYESNSWSGLCHAIHHDGWGDCILCTDAHDLPLGGCFFDTEKEALEAIPTLTPPNEPLTLDELREMDGEPVWVVPIGKCKWVTRQWCVLAADEALIPGVDHWWWSFEDYGETWIAFRRPPEGEEDA